MIAEFVESLEQAGLTLTGGELTGSQSGLTGREIAEALYLALYVSPPGAPSAAVEEPEIAHTTDAPQSSPDSTVTPATHESGRDLTSGAKTQKGDLFIPQAVKSAESGVSALPFRVAAAIALPGAAEIARALRPLLRRFPSRTRREIDVERTVQQIADGGPYAAVERPAPERWLDVALVVDEGASMRVWRPTINELQRLLERHGAFRDVSVWGISSDDGQVRFYRETGLATPPARLGNPRELFDPYGRRLVMLISDCIGRGWHTGAAFRLLAGWGERNPVVLAQVLPQRLWGGTALSPERLWGGTALSPVDAVLRAPAPGIANKRLQPQHSRQSEPTALQGLPLPVVTLEDWSLASWAQMVAARGKATTAGLLITDCLTSPTPFLEDMGEADDVAPDRTEEQSAKQIVARFRASASPMAYRLACYLSAVELTMPVMRLVQQAMLPQSRQIHLAEVFLGGLLRQLQAEDGQPQQPDEIRYDFHPGVRKALLDLTPRSDTKRVMTEVWRLIEQRLPYADDFKALLTHPGIAGEQKIAPGRRAFATISPEAIAKVEVGISRSPGVSGDPDLQPFSIGPGPDPNDPWKGVFGGASERNHRRLKAIVEPLPDSIDLFSLQLTLISTDPDQHPLRGNVTFYFHLAFNRDGRVLSASKDGKQIVCANVSWGAFTVGVEADDGATRLELDLAEQADLPYEYRQPLRELIERAVANNTDLMEHELLEFQNLVRELQAACEARAPEEIIRYLSELGSAFSKLGDNRTAIEFYERALRAARKFGDPAKEAEEISAHLSQLRISESVNKPLRVYLCYVHQDKELKDELLAYLRVLEHRGQMIIWDERGIVSGPGWEDESGRPLEADIELHLLSADFLASDFISDAQIQESLERQLASRVFIVPVILRPCDWSSSPFGQFQALPTNAEPITSWSNRDEAYRSIVEGLRKVVEYIRKQSSNPVGPVQHYDCFISYSQTDAAFALKLYAALERRGVRCWLDEKQLVPGDDIYQQIERGIRLYDKALLCISQASLKSFWVEQEIRAGLLKEEETGKRVLIPLLLDISPIGEMSEGFFSLGGLLSFSDRRRLVDALLDCNCIATPQSRDAIIGGLNKNIRSRIARRGNIRQDVESLVSACLEFARGIESLLETVRYYEGEPSMAWRRLEQVARETLPESYQTENSAIDRVLNRSDSIDFRNWDRSEETFESQLSVVIERLKLFRLSSFEFETVTLDARGKVKERRKLQARQFLEELAPSVTLSMVEIPGGQFMMGSPKDEAERRDSEEPQHRIAVSPFFIGKFAITQAQWRVVAGWPRIERELKPEPSYFPHGNRRTPADDERPVEEVSWEDALEFCARLSRKTGRSYRLPTEAEWEYACRARTTTPFAFGETITHKIVNYYSEYPYAKAKKAKPRGETAPVGSLGVANAFGLFDMHGNVWEWCEDMWHSNYRGEGAPTDGSAWLSGGDSSYRVLRGGSWLYAGGLCRSAGRNLSLPDVRLNHFGFRVVVAARTP